MFLCTFRQLIHVAFLCDPQILIVLKTYFNNEIRLSISRLMQRLGLPFFGNIIQRKNRVRIPKQQC
jgi:hypothetical protein